MSCESSFPTHFILKIAARCNLDCDYCYEFKHADQTWAQKPPIMPISLLIDTLRRIYCDSKTAGLEGIRLTLHGGEPLLAGRSYIGEVCRLVRQHESATGISTRISLQTNGVLLDNEWLDRVNAILS